MIYFGEYLNDYLKSIKMTQSDFALRLGISQKHMNEIIHGKKQVTLDMAANIERLTKIDSRFIMKIENNRKMEENLFQQFETEEKIKENLKKYSISELKRREWVIFRDEKNPIQNSIDLLNFLRVKDFEVLHNIEDRVIFKKKGRELAKLNLWLARCDSIVEDQEVSQYDSKKFKDLIEELKNESYKKGVSLKRIEKVLNDYGIYFVVEKALSGSKVRGAFKVRDNNPAIYMTNNYNTKDSFFFQLFHELGHCKSDYNFAKKMVIVDGDLEKENKADKFALETMIPPETWTKIINNRPLELLKKISEEEKIPMSFIVGRLAKLKYIEYKSVLYNNYKNL